MNNEILSTARSSYEPLYKQVKRGIIRGLAKGEWKPGEAIPTEPQLAATFGVGIATVRAAIGELVAAGVLVRMQGKGTFVTEHNEERIYQHFHVARDDDRMDLPTSELIWLRQGLADPESADQLNLPRDESQMTVYRMRNVLRIFGETAVASDITVPASIFPDLSPEMITGGGRTLYAVYQKHYGISIVGTREKLWATNADRPIAKLLGLKVGTAVLEMRRTAYTFNGLPVELRRSFIRTDGYHYLIEEGSVGP